MTLPCARAKIAVAKYIAPTDICDAEKLVCAWLGQGRPREVDGWPLGANHHHRSEGAMPSQAIAVSKNVAASLVQGTLEEYGNSGAHDGKARSAPTGGEAFGGRGTTQALQLPAHEHRIFFEHHGGLEVDPSAVENDGFLR